MPFFQFESDFVATLRCIPMQVRYSLDTCGVKLKLADWSKLTEAERRELVELPCETVDQARLYRETLHRLVLEHGGDRPADLPIEALPAWMNATTIPASVQQRAEEMAIDLTLAQWASLNPIQRFALIKLSRPSHENHNFLPALKEFGLVSKD